MSDKLYSKNEISKILTKASEIQTQKELYGDKEGLTEEELTQVANEVGIDKDSLAEALDTYDVTFLNDKYEWVKATSKIQKIANIGGEISDADWESVIQEIRKVTGGIGKVYKVGNSYEWEQRRRDIGYKHISLTPQNGQTKIQLVNSWGGLRRASTFISFMGAFALTAIELDGSGLSEYPSIALSIFGGAIGLPFSRVFLRYHYKNQKKQAEDLLQKISLKLRPVREKSINIEEQEVYGSQQNSSFASKTHS